MEKEIESSIHDHPLILRDSKENYGCSVCDQSISGPIYGCSLCKEFVTHKSCTELSAQIQHPLHSQHPLTLLPKTHYDSGKVRCDVCEKVCFCFVFRCAECGFHLDPGCASSPMSTISYEGHPHPLIFLEINYGEHECNICECACDYSIYRCVVCNYNVHKSCTELPKQIQLPFHPLHPLTPMLGTFTCFVCACYDVGKAFQCSKCCFTVHEACAPRVPTIRYEGHEHLLSLIEKFHQELLCMSCGTPCDNAFNCRCVPCNFNLHVHCHPSLPLTIKHKCHIDPLTLTNPDNSDDFDDSEEFYCDACEEKRNPRHPYYYCAECDWVAHIGCVISEGLPFLTAEQEEENVKKAKEADVKLASTGVGFSDATMRDEIMARGLSAALLREKVLVGDTADFTLPKLDEAIAKLGVDIGVMAAKLEAMTTELDALKGKRAHCVASKMLSARDECLSETSITNT